MGSANMQIRKIVSFLFFAVFLGFGAGAVNNVVPFSILSS
jgi:hypothetical protein